MSRAPGSIRLRTKEDPPIVQFWYTNWHGALHQYVIKVEGAEYGYYGAESGPDHPRRWLLHGETITRDGDSRLDMEGGNRRRSFIMELIQDIEVVG
ncbi:MAG: hypothetical protein V4703_08630 [Actinomycetota bacterium]